MVALYLFNEVQVWLVITCCGLGTLGLVSALLRAGIDVLLHDLCCTYCCRSLKFR